VDQQFSIDEIFAIAEQIDRVGAGFYRAAAEIISVDEYQRLLRGLAATEDQHERIFAAMRRDLVHDAKRQSIYDSEDLAAQYLWAWADKTIFDIDADPFKLLTNSSGMIDILKVAIDREKESVVFYTGLRGGVSQAEDRAKVDAIIQEELQHVALLGMHLKRLQG